MGGKTELARNWANSGDSMAMVWVNFCICVSIDIWGSWWCASTVYVVPVIGRKRQKLAFIAFANVFDSDSLSLAILSLFPISFSRCPTLSFSLSVRIVIFCLVGNSTTENHIKNGYLMGSNPETLTKENPYTKKKFFKFQKILILNLYIFWSFINKLYGLFKLFHMFESLINFFSVYFLEESSSFLSTMGSGLSGLFGKSHFCSSCLFFVNFACLFWFYFWENGNMGLCGEVGQEFYSSLNCVRKKCGPKQRARLRASRALGSSCVIYDPRGRPIIPFWLANLYKLCCIHFSAWFVAIQCGQNETDWLVAAKRLIKPTNEIEK